MTLFFTINTCSPDRLTEVDKGRDGEKNKEKCVKKRKKYNVRKEKRNKDERVWNEQCDAVDFNKHTRDRD